MNNQVEQKKEVSKETNKLKIKVNPIHAYFLKIGSMLKSNIRDYGMYIALAAIIIVFTIMTGGIFLTPRNFTNLLNQAAYIAVLAVGMTLVIVIREIDLSVGFIGAFLGAFVVVAVERNNTNLVVALLTALVITIVVGFIKGSLISKIKIPSFVLTLGAMFIFKGLLMRQTNNTTIPISNPILIAIGNGYISEFTVGGFNLLTLIVGALIIGIIIATSFMARNRNKKLGIKNEDFSVFITKLVFMLAVLVFILYSLASFKGVSWLLTITLVVTIVYHFISTKLVLGRRIYAVGGNPDAAELSGISVGKITTIVFVSMGILALIAGVMFVSNVQNTSPQHGVSWEMYAIASSYIGGTSAKGGVGKVINAVVGAIVITSLRNGMQVAGIPSSIEPIILGGVLVLAVVFDIYTRNVKEADYLGQYYAKKENIENYTSTKAAYLEAKKNVKDARKLGVEDLKLVELEYELTRTETEFTRVKDFIGNAKAEDYL